MGAAEDELGQAGSERAVDALCAIAEPQRVADGKQGMTPRGERGAEEAGATGQRRTPFPVESPAVQRERSQAPARAGRVAFWKAPVA